MRHDGQTNHHRALHIALRLPNFFACTLQFIEHHAGAFVKQFTGRGQHHASRFAFKQRCAQIPLQGADAASQCGLCQIKMTRRRTQAALLHDGHHVT